MIHILSYLLDSASWKVRTLISTYFGQSLQHASLVLLRTVMRAVSMQHTDCMRVALDMERSDRDREGIHAI